MQGDAMQGDAMQGKATQGDAMQHQVPWSGQHEGRQRQQGHALAVQAMPAVPAAQSPLHAAALPGPLQRRCFI